MSCSPQMAAAPRRRGRPPLPVELHPTPLWPVDHEPAGFHEALALQMRRHADTAHRLHKAIVAQGARSDRKTLSEWRRGLSEPQTGQSLDTLAAIERRYRLEPTYFSSRLGRTRAIRGQTSMNLTAAESRRLAWHLPDDFTHRHPSDQHEILSWVRSKILSSGTAYARYHSDVSKHRFGLQFSDAVRPDREVIRSTGPQLKAPPKLQEEMRRLHQFKSAVLTEIGYRRSGVWGAATAAQRAEHLALMFGALAAPTGGEVRGYGVPLEHLSFALLLSPSVWDWYIQWRERRRGFFTRWEGEMLLLAAAFSRAETGWLRQSPWLAARLVEVPALITGEEVEAIQADWSGACDRLHTHALARAKEVARVARVHRDPFEPLLPVLESASPVGQYNRIAEEILSRMPCERRHPRAAAEAVRSFLMLRLGLHTGLRQKNLRQLLVCERTSTPLTESDLERLKRGQLRWSARDQGWEVFIPCAAFKNSGSAYFSKRPFRVLLPDLGRLYELIDAYVSRHRAALLGRAADPRTFFIKTVKTTSRSAAYTQTTFYEAWRLTIQRYGIYNPYTGRGAIPDLLPHGPHSVRDVLATHVLKVTGSYEQASYAIQDTPKTVAEHYGRFLPQDKAALAAGILNRVWMAES